jgi:hypothetical protein
MRIPFTLHLKSLTNFVLVHGLSQRKQREASTKLLARSTIDTYVYVYVALHRRIELDPTPLWQAGQVSTNGRGHVAPAKNRQIGLARRRNPKPWAVAVPTPTQFVWQFREALPRPLDQTAQNSSRRRRSRFLQKLLWAVALKRL